MQKVSDKVPIEQTRTATGEVVSPLARSVLTSLHFDTHHRVNLPRSVIGEMASPVWLIFESVADIEVRLADNLNDGRLIDCQFLRS